MAPDQRSRVFDLVNPPGQPSPSPSQAQAPASTPPAASDPSPAPGGGRGIHYAESALERFAVTSDQRSTSFQRIQSQAKQDEVDSGAFGYMFGRLTYSAYERHAESVVEGLQSAAEAMTDIADAVRESAKSIRSVEDETAHAAGQVGGSAG